MAEASGLQSIEIAEHVGPVATGDNVEAKRAANYTWNGTGWNRQLSSLFTLPYDSFYFTNPDGNGNYQTITSKLATNTQETLTLAFDGANNITSIARN